jgi:hypothetical protein
MDFFRGLRKNKSVVFLKEPVLAGATKKNKTIADERKFVAGKLQDGLAVFQGTFKGEKKPATTLKDMKDGTYIFCVKHGVQILPILDGEKYVRVPKELVVDCYNSAIKAVLDGDFDSTISEAVEANKIARAAAVAKTKANKK